MILIGCVDSNLDVAKSVSLYFNRHINHFIESFLIVWIDFSCRAFPIACKEALRLSLVLVGWWCLNFDR